MLYESAQVFPHKNGGWRGQLSYKDDAGRWRKKTKVLASKGKREALKELEAWRAEMERAAQGATISYARPENVGEFVAQYLDTLEASQSVERSTLSAYRSVNKHISAGLSGVPFRDLDADTAQAWVNAMAGDGYAASTIRKAFNLLKAAYTDAVNRRVLPYNPLEAVKVPKLRRNEPNALDMNQRAKLLAYLDIAGATPINIAVCMALLTGMREGELCGLRWKDVDLKAGVLHVRNVIGRDGGKSYEKEPKTGGSRRDIPLSPELVALLKGRRADMVEECLEAGVPLTLDMYVFGRIDGRYLEPHTLWREWKAVAKSLGLVGTEGKAPTFHDLRHTFATVAILSGIDVKTVSSILGHANAAMTLNIYASADAEAKRRAMENVSRTMMDTSKPAEILQIKKTGTDGA